MLSYGVPAYRSMSLRVQVEHPGIGLANRTQVPLVAAKPWRKIDLQAFPNEVCRGHSGQLLPIDGNNQVLRGLQLVPEGVGKPNGPRRTVVPEILAIGFIIVEQDI